MMKQAQQMQSKLKENQEKLQNSEYKGESGGGMVSVTINGAFDAKKILIDESLIDKNEKEMLEDLIIAAFNNAKKKAEDESKESMQDLTGGLNIPPDIFG